jgi:HPt (histidine-containing phosphotransfer) domain-containing protein
MELFADGGVRRAFFIPPLAEPVEPLQPQDGNCVPSSNIPFLMEEPAAAPVRQWAKQAVKEGVISWLNPPPVDPCWLNVSYGGPPFFQGDRRRLDRAKERPERRAQRITDEIDEQLLPIFLEESADLMASIASQLRGWRDHPGNDTYPTQLKRDLHTIKGSARMAGAMGCGELLHSMEDRIDQATRMKSVQAATIDGLLTALS